MARLNLKLIFLSVLWIFQNEHFQNSCFNDFHILNFKDKWYKLLNKTIKCFFSLERIIKVINLKIKSEFIYFDLVSPLWKPIIFYFKRASEPILVPHACNSNAEEANTSGSQIWNHSGIYRNYKSNELYRNPCV